MPTRFRIKVASTVVDVHATFHRVYKVCKDFVTEDKASMEVFTGYADLNLEALKAEQEFEINAPSNVIIEAIALLRKLSDVFINENILLMHGAVVAVKGGAYMFSATSGIGKTTHILKWRDYLPDSFVVNGDKPFLRFQNDGTVLACGSPWAGKENLYTNTMVPLKSIIQMERAEENHIEQITFAEAFPKLLQQVYRPDDEEKMRKTLRLLQQLSPAVTFWRFQCNNFKDDCFDVAYNALVRDQK